MHTIAVAGHICVDIRPELESNAKLAPGRLIEVGPIAMRLGGAVGNTGIDLATLGAPVRMATSIGDDSLGEFVRTTLAGQGHGIGGVAVVAGGSTSYSLILEPGGLDRTIWHNVGVNAQFDGRSIELGGVDVLHLGYPPLLPALVADDGALLDELLTRARAAGVTMSVDLANVDPASAVGAVDWNGVLARMAAKTDVLSPSLDDLTSALGIDEPFSAVLIDRLLDVLLGWGVAVVALSAGEHGLYVRTAGPERLARAGRALAPHAQAWADRDLWVDPVWHDTPVTTNGAGDASTAGLVFGIAAGAGADQSALLAAACSGAIVSGRQTTRAAVCELRPELAPIFDKVDRLPAGDP